MTDIRADLSGLTQKASQHARNHSHFAAAHLAPAVRIQATNLDAVREEDILGSPNRWLMVVADGLSEAPAPSQASAVAVQESLKFALDAETWTRLDTDDNEERTAVLGEVFAQAQEQLDRSVERAPAKEGMGSAMTLAYVRWPQLHVMHAGDSRCYVHRAGGVRRVTEDHTLGQVIEGLGGSDPSRKDDPNVLWNVVGGHTGEARPQGHSVQLQSGDAVLLCTDGVAREHTESEIKGALATAPSSREACERLLRREGGMDQTVVMARFLDPDHQREPVASSVDPVTGGVSRSEPRANEGDPKTGSEASA